ncbi:MAG: peptide chain release factor N(5)-glutamine methyltransferase [Planctomycetaceae bacterium]|jgi:release factor glutamine methyltransferase|nr:peptide chain release factor N(5)-glutamine methyltransferase [Planctomycetaceae bacterium]
MSSEQWTVKRLLEWTREFFRSKGIEKPLLEAEILLSTAMKIKRIEIYTNYETEPDESQRAVFRDFVKRRGNGEPAAYLAGYKEFYSLSFKVDKHVLIPRPETEDLVLKTLDILKTYPDGSRLTVADIGTGSGAVAVALAKNLPPNAAEAKIFAVDINCEALSLAKQNAETNGAAEQITFRQSDLLGSVAELLDVIVANLPYVSEAEYDMLPSDVRSYEPKPALLAGKTGTEIIERLIYQSADRLKDGGHILLEVSPMIAGAVKDAAAGLAGGRKNAEIILDSYNRERIVHIW